MWKVGADTGYTTTVYFFMYNMKRANIERASIPDNDIKIQETYWIIGKIDKTSETREEIQPQIKKRDAIRVNPSPSL